MYFFRRANNLWRMALCVSISACGEPPAPQMMQRGEEVQALLDGAACADHEYGETGLVRSKGSLLTHLCTGTLIAPDVVLTAAHCIGGGGSLSFTPRARSASPMSRDAVSVVKAVVHPRFDISAIVRLPLMLRLLAPCDARESEAVQQFDAACGEFLLPGATNIFHTSDMLDLLSCIAELPITIKDSLEISNDSREVHDIAILFLEHPVTTAPVALLPTALAWDGVRAASLVGYGENSTSWWSWLTGQAFGSRFAGTTYVYRVGTRELTLLPGPARPRPGDSGGPLLVHTPEGHVIGGIASRVNLSKVVDTPFSGIAYYTRVDAYLEWIALQVKAYRGGSEL